MNMEQFKLDSKFADKEGEILVVELNGYVDHTNSDRLQKMFSNVAESENYKIIVDFAGLEYMSSVGWGIFVGEIKRFRDNGGDIKLTCMKPDIYDVFQMLEFYHIFEDYPTIKDAFDSFEMLDGNELNFLLGADQNSSKAAEVEAVDLGKEEFDADELFSSIEDDFTPQTGTPVIREGYKSADATETRLSSQPARQSIDAMVKSESSVLATLPVSEKVKQLIARQPLLGTWGIKKVLGHKQFGFTKIGFFKLRKLLKSLDLDNKKKRYRYYRSC